MAIFELCQYYLQWSIYPPFFKKAKHFKNWRTTDGILSEGHFHHIICFWANIPYFLTKINAHSFLVLGHSECGDYTNPPVLYLGSHETERSQSEGSDCEQVETGQNTLWRSRVPGCQFISEDLHTEWLQYSTRIRSISQGMSHHNYASTAPTSGHQTICIQF